MSLEEGLIFVLSGGGSTEPCQFLATQAQWCIPTAPALRKLRQEDGEIEASLDHTETLQKKNNNRKRMVHLAEL